MPRPALARLDIALIKVKTGSARPRGKFRRLSNASGAGGDARTDSRASSQQQNFINRTSLVPFRDFERGAQPDNGRKTPFYFVLLRRLCLSHADSLVWRRTPAKSS